MVANLKVNRPSPSRLTVMVSDEDGMPVSQPTQQVSSVTYLYANYSILDYDATCGSVWRQTQTKTLKQSRSSGSSSIMYGAVQKHQRKIAEVLGPAAPTTGEVKVKTEDQIREIFNVMELVESTEFSPQVAEEMRKMPVAMSSICSIHSDYFRKILEEHEFTHA